MTVPGYDRSQTLGKLAHIGVGGFNRSHLAVYLDDLLGMEAGGGWGEFGIGLLAGDKPTHLALTAQNHLYGLLLKDAAGMSYRVIGSLVGHCLAQETPEAAIAAMSAKDCEIVSLTVTEGGYFLDDATGKFAENDPQIRRDLEPSAQPKTWPGYVAAAAERRMSRGGAPFTLMSCDNLQGNGHAARAALLAFAELKDARLRRWIEANVLFPNSMVDRITPRTTDADREAVARDFGVDDRALVVSEPFRQWVLEDTFAAGRPAWELAGAQMTADVAPYEAMKMRLLNGGHSALGYCAALLGIEYVSDALRDPLLRRLLSAFLAEAKPAVPPLPGIDLDEYAATIVERFANPRIRDQISRICSNGSAKIAKFLLPTARDLLAAGAQPRVIPLAIASWLRYLGGKDDQGAAIEIIEPDPELPGAFLSECGRDAGAAVPGRSPGQFPGQCLFGDVAAIHPEFVESIKKSLLDFRSLGARRTIERALDQNHPGETTWPH